MKKTIAKKICISLLSASLLVTGTLFSGVNTNNIYAFGELQFAWDLFGWDGIAYKFPDWMKRLRGYLSSNEFQELYDNWCDIVETGIITLPALSVITKHAAAKNINVDAWNLILGQFKTGTMDNNSSKLFKALLGSTQKQTIGSVNDVDDSPSIISKVVNWFKNNSVGADVLTNYDSDYLGWNNIDIQNKRLYTVADSDNNYNSGDLTNQNIYDNSNQKFYDVVNNTSHNVTNYNYDLSNNTYDFSTDDGYQFLMSNSTRYIEITSKLNGVSNKYRQYYALPDGSNTYNLTDDQVHGIKTDFNVYSYTNTYDYDDLKYLYHFDGDLNNSAYDTNNRLYNGSIGSNFTFVNDVYDTALIVDNQSFNLIPTFFEDFSNYFYLSFRFMPSIILNGGLRIEYFNNNGQRVIKEFNKEYTNDVAYVEKSYSQNFNNLGVQYQYLQVEANTPTNATNFCTGIGGSPQGNPITTDQNKYSIACKILVNSGNNITTTNKQYIAETSTNIEYSDNFAKNINFENWNTFEMYKMNNNNLRLRINTAYYDITDINYSRGISVYGNTDNYLLIDELALFNSNTYKSHVAIRFLPFDSNQVFTLPNDLKFDNNTILLKTTRNINNWQIGGLRSSTPSNNDIYISVDENDTITSCQQYVNGNWISIDGAVYSEYLGKFVSIIGYSISIGDNKYQDIEVQDSNSIIGLSGWLSNTLNDIKDTISNGFNAVNDKLDKILNPSKDKENDIYDQIDKASDINDTIDVNLENDLENDIDSISTLATSVNEIFDVIIDSGAGIILTAPLVIFLIRLVI